MNIGMNALSLRCMSKAQSLSPKDDALLYNETLLPMLPPQKITPDLKEAPCVTQRRGLRLYGLLLTPESVR
jgi:hypothetical protein